jgi:hypothetical protein
VAGKSHRERGALLLLFLPFALLNHLYPFLLPLPCPQDWSWNRPALDYIELYHGAKKA